jgi:hypothetical protein
MRPRLLHAIATHAKVEAAFPMDEPRSACDQKSATHLLQLAALGLWGDEGVAWEAPPQAQSAAGGVAELLPHHKMCQQAHADPC